MCALPCSLQPVGSSSRGQASESLCDRLVGVAVGVVGGEVEVVVDVVRAVVVKSRRLLWEEGYPRLVMHAFGPNTGKKYVLYL